VVGGHRYVLYMKNIRVLILPVLVLAFAACSDKTADKVDDAVKSAGTDVRNATDTITARAQAEALRAAILADDTATDVRSIVVLKQSANDLPGDPKVTGIVDADSDGRDDDGLVEVRVGDQAACVRLPASGGDINVDTDACTPA
jgi:hypothetical protein